jgi:hypothetical protein
VVRVFLPTLSAHEPFRERAGERALTRWPWSIPLLRIPKRDLKIEFDHYLH